MTPLYEATAYDGAMAVIARQTAPSLLQALDEVRACVAQLPVGRTLEITVKRVR